MISYFLYIENFYPFYSDILYLYLLFLPPKTNLKT
nr:MAG TPA: hypothetical protein [Caudoviricetes sp.]